MPTHRLLSIVGSPGVGKSYLLNRARHLIQSDGSLVLWIDLSRSEAIRGDCPDLTDPKGLQAWLEKAVAHAHDKCPRVRRYDSSIPPDAMLDTLVSDLCESCDAGLMPILIVDGFEEVPNGDRDKLEERVLASFLRRSCTRMLIGLRDVYSLHTPELRWTEHREALSVMSETDAYEQIQTRLANWPDRPRDEQADADPLPNKILDDLSLKQIIPGYKWDHPGINSYLLERVIPRWRTGQPPFLNLDDLYNCVIEVTRAGDSTLSGRLQHFAALAKEFPRGWSDFDLPFRIGSLTLGDADLSVLFERGIASPKEGMQRYQIADGLRELLQALKG